MSSTQTDTLDDLRNKVEEEIKEHPSWCGKDCQTFLPDAYREARIQNGYSAETVQRDYDLCHIWR